MRKILFLLAMAIFALIACEKDEATLTNNALEWRQLTGAIFSTCDCCTGVDVNIFYALEDVFLDGGPRKIGQAGLPPGEYYVKVTEPDGTLLGTSVGGLITGWDETPIVVGDNGEFVTCYRLWDIVVKASDLSEQGYDMTSNPGGEYKIWVSNSRSFEPDNSKTDNFKVRIKDTPPPTYTLKVLKFYDANANGINDDGQLINDWKVYYTEYIDEVPFTFDLYTPVEEQLEAGTYTVGEYLPLEINWKPTTPTFVDVTLPPDALVEFGNLCLGGGGGLTLGFWSNKNGQALFGTDDLALMVGLNLRNANGNHFDPANYAAFRTWLLNANATNMAYMLSAQMAAMQLNVFNGKVSGGALIYAPGTTSANALGYATVNSVLAEANAELGLHGYVLADSPYRIYQEALKNALDKANNNYTFVQPKPCPFTF